MSKDVRLEPAGGHLRHAHGLARTPVLHRQPKLGVPAGPWHPPEIGIGIGTGTGTGTGTNLSHYPADVDLTGIDWSPDMLRVARHRAEREPRAVALTRAGASALPFPTATFDTVVSTFALCCIPDERAALAEALRVLRPGGRLLLVDHVVASFWPLRALQHAVDLVTVPLHGEHHTRRPVTILRGLGVTIDETERLTRGAIERVQARKPH